MLLSLNNIQFEFGAHTIFENASWHIYANERIGLVGLNGAGKSTLFKILVGQFSISAGTVNKSNDLKIGYFHQDLQSEDVNESIHQVAMRAYDEALELRDRLDAIALEIEKDPNDKLIEKQGDLLHRFEVAGGYEMDYTTAEVLEGLGFTTKDLDRPFKEFSGGWRMRVLLAKMILQHPDILLLDEPTNHLDLPSIEWIERYLQSYQGTIVVISHDRYFLDRMVTKIVEVGNKTLTSYTGTYTNYEEEKAVRAEFTQREFENQQEYIRQQERFVERFKAKASKATQAQSIVKKLNRLDRIESPETASKAIDFRFETGIQPGKIITTLKNVSKSYGDIKVLDNANAVINRGDKIALIGPNGKGKSTLLRLIANSEEMEGESIIGHNVQTSFYAQHQLDSLTMDNEILKELNTSGSDRSDVELRQLLGCFLFTGDDVFKRIKVLSGGEKARVALAKTIIQQSNFLMLDEPTNHLDINSVNSLVNALNAYEGTYVIVSHDRFFIERTATVIWEIDDKKINVFDGNYKEFLAFKERQKERNKAANKEESRAEVKAVEEPKVSNKERQENRKEKKRIKNRFNKLEQLIAEAEEGIKQFELDLVDPTIFADQKKFKEKESAYKDTKSKLVELKTEYEEVFEKMLAYED